jgi:predicted naringenin-chalcone synthase
VLLCAAELCTLHMQYGSDPDSLVANALFADGAGALVLGNSTGSEPSLGSIKAVGSCLVPDCEDAMSWNIGDHGFQMTLSSQVPALIKENLRGWIVPWLAQFGLRISDVQAWAVHPGGPRILDAVESALSLPKEALSASREILAKHGNMSSPTVLFVLEKLRAGGKIPAPCVILGFGPGLMVEAVFVE